MTQETTTKNYIDITNELLKNKILDTQKIIDSYFYISHTKIYIVDRKKVVLDYSYDELKTAYWLIYTFGGEIYMNPRVNVPNGVKTADYWWRGEYWDLKMPKGSSKRTIENLIKNSKEQSKNFIIDISKSKLKIIDSKEQIENIYNNTSRLWIDKIILKKNNKLIKIYKRK